MKLSLQKNCNKQDTKTQNKVQTSEKDTPKNKNLNNNTSYDTPKSNTIGVSEITEHMAQRDGHDDIIHIRDTNSNISH